MPSAASTAARISGGSARRPTPHSPFDASRPVPGSTIRAPLERSSSRFAWVAGCSYMWVFIAGASTSGAVLASAAEVSRLSASPWASFATVFAEAGATTSTSQRAHELQVRDRVVVEGRVAREGAARRVGLELVDQHGRAGHALEGGAADELKARRRLHDTHGVARRRGKPHKLDRFVGGNPPAYAEQDAGHAPPSGSGT